MIKLMEVSRSLKSAGSLLILTSVRFLGGKKTNLPFCLCLYLDSLPICQIKITVAFLFHHIEPKCTNLHIKICNISKDHIPSCSSQCGNCRKQMNVAITCESALVLLQFFL